MDTTRDDNAAITRLLVRHRSDLFAYILACVRNHADSEEVFQEVSVAIVTSFHKLRDQTEFMPWAREIARRQINSFFRRSTRPMLYDSDLVDILAQVANHMSEEEQNRREQALRDCLERLPRKSKQVLLMRYDDSGSGIDQIAKRLGRSMAATYGVLKRLRMSLRSCVERRLSAEVQHEQSTK